MERLRYPSSLLLVCRPLAQLGVPTNLRIPVCKQTVGTPVIAPL